MRTLLPLLTAALPGLATAIPLAHVYVKPADTTASLGFGRAVAISGDTVAVSATGFVAAIYIFVRNGTTWSQQGYDFTTVNPYWTYRFGDVLALSGDTLVVGDSGESNSASGVNGNQQNGGYSSYSGAAYIFTRSGTTWSQQAYLKASNRDADDHFGIGVAISGDTMVVGAPDEDSAAVGVNGDQASNGRQNSGAAYVFTRSGTTWTQQAYLKASNPTDWGEFGVRVAISGDTILVGATGSAYVFTRSGSTWTQQAQLKASNAATSGYFGYSLALDGNTAVVGAYGEKSNATGVNGNQTNENASGAGAAYVFTRSGTTWTQEAYLKASNTGVDDNFGASVAVSGDKVLVGTSQEDSASAGLDGDQASNAAAGSGAAYLFTRKGTTWTQQSYIKASNTAAGDGFGGAVALSGDTVVAGAQGEDSHAAGINGNQADEDSADSGAVYIITPPKTAIRTIPPMADNVTGGGTQSFPVMLINGSYEITFGLYHYGSSDLLLTGSPALTATGNSDFSVTAQPGLQTIPWNGSTTFKVRFTPTGPGPQATTLSIPTNDPTQNPIQIQLSGRGLSFADDTDGDGVNDASEFNMAALGFNWQVNQPALANPLLADRSRMQLYTPGQIQALYPGTTLSAKDPVSGRFKVTTRLKKSDNLADFFDLPAPAGSSVSINASNKIEFEFPVPDKKAFFRLEPN